MITRRKLRLLVPFVAFWLVFSLLYILIEYGLLAGSQYYPVTGNAYEPANNLIIVTGTSIFAGLLMGFIEVFYFRQRLSNKTLLSKIFLKTLVYLGLITFFLLFTSAINAFVGFEEGLSDSDFWRVWSKFVVSPGFLSIFVYIGVVITLSLFTLEMIDHIGREVIDNFFVGKYHKPRQEERIFMFVDMKDSTPLAEEMGSVLYFKMLKAYYKVLSKAVEINGGDIYQYVGDEIVITWKVSDKHDNSRALKCFQDMELLMKQNESMFLKDFDKFPEFKAAIHCGTVTTGELGTIKKGITFTGDVMNTTSRVQGLCNKLKSSLLITETYLNDIDEEKDHFQYVGEQELKGKNRQIKIYKRNILNVV